MEHNKFILEFDEPPALVFVQREVGSKFEVYQDGKRLKSVLAVTIRARCGEFTTHEVEFLTGRTKREDGICEK